MAIYVEVHPDQFEEVKVGTMIVPPNLFRVSLKFGAGSNAQEIKFYAYTEAEAIVLRDALEQVYVRRPTPPPPPPSEPIPFNHEDLPF